MSKTSENTAAVGCIVILSVMVAFAFLCTIASFGGAFIAWVGSAPVSLTLAIPLTMITWFCYRGMVGIWHEFWKSFLTELRK